MNRWIKIITAKFADHLFGIIVGAIITPVVVASVVVLAIFWKWVIARHSVELYGWIWLLLCLVGLLLLVHFVYVMFDSIRRIKDPADIRNVLERCWRDTKKEEPDKLDFTLFFSPIDKTEGLKKGSAKKYLRDVVTKDGKWGVVREGPDTLLVKRHQSPQAEIMSSIMKKI